VLLVDNSALAVKALAEQYPFTGMLLANVVYNREQMRELQNNLNASDNTDSVSIANEMQWADPDLRSWLTLPDNVQIFEQALSSGHYSLMLNSIGNQQAASVIIASGKITLLWVTDLGTSLMINTYNL